MKLRTLIIIPVLLAVAMTTFAIPTTTAGATTPIPASLKTALTNDVKRSPVPSCTDATITAIVCPKGMPIVLTMNPAIKAQQPTAGKPTAPPNGVYITYGWDIYVHLTPQDVGAVYWVQGRYGWAATLALVCLIIGAVFGEEAGVVCGMVMAWAGWWMPFLFTTAWSNRSGLTMWAGIDGVGYYYSE